MRISNHLAMSNLIPPMISDSPPPLDLEVDDNDDDDGFGDFRVATDLAFDLSDTSLGRDSPDVWNTPSTYSEPSEEKLAKLVIDLPKKSSSELADQEFHKEVINNGIVNGVDDKSHDKEPSDFEDSPELIEELERIPFEPVFEPCNVELEKRTSPEGADADTDCTREEDFDFQLKPEPNNCDKNANISDSLVVETKDEDFGDFADFSSHRKEDDDDFDDFEFAAPPVETPTTEDEDFGAKLTAIFEGVEETSSPSDDPQLTGCLHSCLDDSSSVWGHLKDLDTSHALALQWSSSFTSKKLLSSLNVDSRNILVGQRWNLSMPRFAANLGCAPLEPMKAASDETQPLPEVDRTTLANTEEVVPAAQFDWNSSGLTNPLDCMDKEETSVPKHSAKEIRTDSFDVPVSDIWESSDVPVADILLPSPVVPDVSTLEPIIQPSQLTQDEFERNWPEMITISSQLKEPEREEKSKISEEARRVVDSLPDLSFLSAKKLLYAANANRSRFQALARP